MISKDIEKVLLTEEQIEQRCKELAAQIEHDYEQENTVPIIVGLLRGSVPFMAELIKRFTFPCEIDFMSVSSYDGTESIGDVRIEKDMDLSSKDRAILVCRGTLQICFFFGEKGLLLCLVAACPTGDCFSACPAGATAQPLAAVPPYGWDVPPCG